MQGKPQTPNQGGQGPRLSQEKLDALRVLGGCFGCGQVGHLRRNCPTNPSKPRALPGVTGQPSGRGQRAQGNNQQNATIRVVEAEEGPKELTKEQIKEAMGKWSKEDRIDFALEEYDTLPDF